jgi:hypothetical protein
MFTHSPVLSFKNQNFIIYLLTYTYVGTYKPVTKRLSGPREKATQDFQKEIKRANRNTHGSKRKPHELVR